MAHNHHNYSYHTQNYPMNSSANAQSYKKTAHAFLSKSHRLNELHDSTDVTHSCIATESLQQRGGAAVNATGAVATSTANGNCAVISGGNYQQIVHLDLANFKCHPCRNQAQHNHKHCPCYHNAKDRKRAGNFYSADLCEFVERGENCPYGDNCAKSHNRVEQLYQQDKYKTKFCT